MSTDAVIGMRLRIEYADQNESFAPFLPRTGTIIRRCVTTAGDENWFHLLLDAGFKFQAQLENPFRFRLIDCTEFLIQSRHLGKDIGQAEPTHVFIVLVSSEQRVVDPIDLHEFYHAAWGISHTI
jgi:hypothetical protein